MQLAYRIFRIFRIHLFISDGHSTNSQNNQLTAGLLVQLEQHYTGITEVMG